MSKATAVPEVAKPGPRPVASVAPCPVGKKGVHNFVVVENAHNTETYMAKCKYCGRYISRPNS